MLGRELDSGDWDDMGDWGDMAAVAPPVTVRAIPPSKPSQTRHTDRDDGAFGFLMKSNLPRKPGSRQERLELTP